MTANHLDGAIIANANFNYGTGGVNIGGMISAGKIRDITSLDSSATDKSPVQVWNQKIESSRKKLRQC